jgi:uncharacterized protein (TIGR04255 family)
VDTERSLNPLVAPVPEEVPLKAAPLVRVVAQVRFPLVASIEQRDFIAPFQETVRHEYPALRPEKSFGLALGANGLVETQAPTTIWRFEDISGDWRASLAPSFVALETTRYSSRADFLDRFERLLRATKDHVDPQVVDRLGIRYIDRVEWSRPEDFRRLVSADVAGPLLWPVGDMVKQAVTQSIFVLPDGTGELMVRWGLVPANSTIDPSAVEPSSSPSWLLDLDAYANRVQPFDVDALLGQTRLFAERVYTFFRWMVTDEFLRQFGGRA